MLKLGAAIRIFIASEEPRLVKPVYSWLDVDIAP
jgi:hypothetical protein